MKKIMILLYSVLQAYAFHAYGTNNNSFVHSCGSGCALQYDQQSLIRIEVC